VDLENVEETRKAVQSIGDIDLLVNNAGIFIGQSFLDTTPEAFDKTIAVNTRSVLIVSQIFAKKLIERKKPGAIVNISSQASVIALQNHTSYCASKGALDQLTRVMALELAPHNIRVNSVNPNVIVTPMSQHWLKPENAEPMLAKIPMHKFGTPHDVSSAVTFLLSDHASFITGSMLMIDGGYTAV